MKTFLNPLFILILLSSLQAQNDKNDISFDPVFGKKRISTGIYINNHFSDYYMPKYSGNLELAYIRTFGNNKYGIGGSSGIYIFAPVNYIYDIKLRHYAIPVEVNLLKIFSYRSFNIELNGSTGIYLLFGTETYQKVLPPDWNGQTHQKGDRNDIGVWPGAILGVNTVIGKRIGTYNYGVRFGYKYFIEPFGGGTDMYVPGNLCGGFNLGIRVAKWIGRHNKLQKE